MSTPRDLQLENQLKHTKSIEFLSDNIFDILELKNKKALPKVEAMSKMVRPTFHLIEKKYRKKTKPKPVDEHLRKCINCDSTLTLKQHSCVKCATVQEDTWLEMPSVNEMKFKIQTHQIPCAYKRINHFNEKLAQFQGKEKTVVSSMVFDAIQDEIKKNNKMSLETLTPAGVKYLLKKLNLSKFYEHINFITHKLNGYTLPTLSQTEEDKLRNMFNMIQTPFAKHAPPWRKNFLNYAYIFRKFMELLSYDWLLDHFSELKSREKLYEQDKIWYAICKDLEWEYIPSM